jgi:hypothetical protein
MAIGGAFVDGGVLLQQWMTSPTPGLLVDAVRKGLDILVPRFLQELPAGGWITVGLEHKPGTFESVSLNFQLQLDAPLAREAFASVIGSAAPAAVQKLAEALMERIGIDSIAIQRPVIDRRVLH